MAVIKPGGFQRNAVDPIVALFTKKLVVKGRTTGKEESLPVNVLEHEGGTYLMAPRGETDWVRNLRAAGEGEIRRRNHVLFRFTAEELPVDLRPPIIAAYRDKWDSQVKKFFEQLPDPADHPVFRLTKIASGS
jgi:deazaflavin-dependent oxidoreductase (nitroreductase family)